MARRIQEVVHRALARGEVYAPAAIDEAWGDVGAVLADARQEPSLGGRILARATRSRSVEGTVALGPNRDALAERALPDHELEQEAVVLASGNLALIYLPLRPERLTLEQIDDAHPQLLETLTAHPGVGFVMVRSDDHGAVVMGRAGRRSLADDSVAGEDPLAHFDRTAAEHLRRHDRFPHCPDILVNSTYDPEAVEVAPFEEFMGSHGGLGGPQTHPFAVVPADWGEPAAPIVGVQAMHALLRDWLAQSRRVRLTAE